MLSYYYSLNPSVSGGPIFTNACIQLKCVKSNICILVQIRVIISMDSFCCAHALSVYNIYLSVYILYMYIIYSTLTTHTSRNSQPFRTIKPVNSFNMKRDGWGDNICDMSCSCHTITNTHMPNNNENDRYELAQQFIIRNHHKNKQLNSNNAVIRPNPIV